MGTPSQPDTNNLALGNKTKVSRGEINTILDATARKYPQLKKSSNQPTILQMQALDDSVDTENTQSGEEAENAYLEQLKLKIAQDLYNYIVNSDFYKKPKQDTTVHEYNNIKTAANILKNTLNKGKLPTPDQIDATTKALASQRKANAFSKVQTAMGAAVVSHWKKRPDQLDGTLNKAGFYQKHQGSYREGDYLNSMLRTLYDVYSKLRYSVLSQFDAAAEAPTHTAASMGK